MHEHVICTKCLVDLPRTHITDLENNPIAQLFWGRIRLKYSSAFYYYTKGSKYLNIIHGLKYEGRQYIGTEVGKLFGAELLSTVMSKVDLVVPVPLHPRKLKKRGFNQSELIAKGIAEMLGKNTESRAIERIVDTNSQTRRSRFQRWENVEGIFKVKKPDIFKNTHILLVDDVVTTGSTFESCATEILKIEGATVSVAALAVAKYN